MNSSVAARLGSQTPRVSSHPPYVTSAADEVIDLAEAAGLVLDPWQRYVLTHGLGERADGRWAALTVSTWVPRQNGKGAIIEALELAWLFLFGERLVLHSAHEYKTAQEAFLRIKTLVEGCPDLRRQVRRVWQANGEQGIELLTGQRLRFVARSRTSGRGFSGDKNILDEGQELTVEQMAALMPTMSARDNPQVWIFGTPPDDPAAWVYGLKADGEAGADGLAHFDWGIDGLDMANPDDVARLADRELWYAANPALGIRITEEFVAHELPLLGALFAPERLGLWLPPAADATRFLDPKRWAALADPDSQPGDDLAIAVETTLDRTWSSIGLYAPRPDGLGHIEVIDHRPGTDWVVERVVELRGRYRPVGIGLDLRGPAGALEEDFRAAGIVEPDDPERPERGQLAVPTATDTGQACGQIVDAVRQGADRHRDQTQLNTAVSVVKTRSLGGSLAWARQEGVVDSPITAATLARWVYITRAPLVGVRRLEGSLMA
jgi:hypothetical protein